METERHALGQLHPGHVTASEVTRVEHRELGGVVVAVVYERHEPTVVLVGAAGTSHEHRLAGRTARTVIEHLALAGVQIVLERGPVHRVGIGLGAVAVAIGLAGERTAVTRELVGRLIDRRDRRGTRARIDFPANQTSRRVAERTVEIVAHHSLVEAHVEHDLAVGRVVRVERVEHVAHGHIDPHDVGRRALTRHQTHAVAVVVVPPERERAAGERQVEVDQHRLVVHHHVAIGDRHVVHHRHARQRNVDRAVHSAVLAHAHVLDVVEPLCPGVDHGVHLARCRIDLRVGGECAGQRAEEVVVPDGLEFVRELDRASTGLDHGPRGAGERTHVRVGPARRIVPITPRRLSLAAHFAHALRADVTIAVPLGAALAQTNAVHHAVADEPVVRRRIDLADRVRPVAQVAAVEFFGEFADHLQIGRCDFLGDGCVIAREVPVVGGGIGKCAHVTLSSRPR